MTRYVVRAIDERPPFPAVPEIGLVVGWLSATQVVVAWGDEKYAELPRVSVESVDRLVPARPVNR